MLIQYFIISLLNHIYNLYTDWYSCIWIKAINTCGIECVPESSSADGICLKEDKLYHSVSGSANCIKDDAVATMTAGYHIFSVTDITATPVTKDSTGLTAGNLVLFQCISGGGKVTCQRGAGIVNVDSKYYSIPAAAEATDETTSITSTNSNNVIIKNASDSAVLTLPTDDAFPAAATSEKSYILKGKSDVITEAPFGGLNTSSEEDSGIVLSTKAISGDTPAMLVFNSAFNGKYLS